MNAKRREGIRYQTPEGPETGFQPGSRGRVLRNLLGITRKGDMDCAEYEALLKTQELFVERVGPETRFTAEMIRQMHRRWLGGIYSWAGHYRTVELQKGSFRWPPALRVAQNMQAFEGGILRRNTPCRPDALEHVALRMAEVHAELLLIHPFREGNGRLARWLSDLMALQAGYPPPEYGFEGRRKQKTQEFYLAAVTQGYARNYDPLTTFFLDAIAERMEKRE